MSASFSAEAAADFYLRVQTWVASNPLLTLPGPLTPENPKFSRKLSNAPFSIMQLTNPFNHQITILAVSDMEIGTASEFGRAKIAYPLSVNAPLSSDTTLATINFNQLWILETIRHKIMPSEDRGFFKEPTKRYLDKVFSQQFFEATRPTFSSKPISTSKDELNDPQKFYYVTPFYGGVTLDQYLNIAYANKKVEHYLTLIEFFVLAIGIGRIIKQLHDQHHIHRHITPQNIIVSWGEKSVNVHFCKPKSIAKENDKLLIFGDPQSIYLRPELQENPEIAHFTSVGEDIYAYFTLLKELFEATNFSHELIHTQLSIKAFIYHLKEMYDFNNIDQCLLKLTQFKPHSLNLPPIKTEYDISTKHEPRTPLQFNLRLKDNSVKSTIKTSLV